MNTDKTALTAEIKDQISKKFGFLSWETMMQEFWFKGKIGRFNDTPFEEILDSLLNEFSSQHNKDLSSELELTNQLVRNREEIIFELQSKIKNLEQQIKDSLRLYENQNQTIIKLQQKNERLASFIKTAIINYQTSPLTAKQIKQEAEKLLSLGENGKIGNPIQPQNPFDNAYEEKWGDKYCDCKHTFIDARLIGKICTKCNKEIADHF